MNPGGQLHEYPQQAALFVIVNNWKPLNCLSTEDWLNKIVIYLCNRISKTLSWKKKQVAE